MKAREFACPVDGALFARSLGLLVFPLKVNGKKPEFEGWQAWATDASEQKIRDWGTANPLNNWGVSCGPSGLIVIDIDNKNSSTGSATFRQLLSDRGQDPPAAFVVETPTGGYHLYFKGEGRNRVGALGKSIDVRGAGGYVVAPGSRINDKAYVIKQDVPIPPIPSWLSDELAKGQSTPAPEIKSIVVEGERNHTLMSFAGTMRNRGAEYPVILAALYAMNEHQVSPPLPDEEIETIAASVARYEPKVAKAAVDFSPTVTQASKPASAINPDTIPKRDWIMRHRYIAGFVSLIVSPGGVGKSAFTMLDAVAIATGRPLTGFDMPAPAPVWLYNTEDPSDELDRRMIALSIAHGIPLSTLGNVRITSGRDAPLVLASGDNKGVIVIQPAIDHVVNHVNELGIRVLIVDPFVRTHRVQENDNAQIDAVLWCFQQIIDKTNCAVGIVHHTRKPTEASGGGSMHDARGASALVNAARIAHTLSTMTKEEANAFGIVEERRRYYIRLDNVKANLHPPAERADWYEKVSVTLPNDDDVGTLRHTPLATLAAERKRQKREQQIVDIGIMLNAVMDLKTERSIAEVYRDLRDTTEFERLFKVTETTARKLIIELLHDAPKCNGKVFTYRRKAHGQTQNMVVCTMALDILEI